MGAVVGECLASRGTNPYNPLAFLAVQVCCYVVQSHLLLLNTEPLPQYKIVPGPPNPTSIAPQPQPCAASPTPFLSTTPLLPLPVLHLPPGSQVVVAESYARIFFRNCISTGELYPVETDLRLCQELKTGDDVEVSGEGKGGSCGAGRGPCIEKQLRVGRGKHERPGGKASP